MDLTKATALRPKALALWLQKARVASHEPAKQLEALHRAAEAAGDEIGLFDEVAKLASDTPHQDAWLSQLSARASTDQTATAFLRLAHARAMAGDWRGAHESCESALAQDPKNVALRVDTLCAAANAGRLEPALEHVSLLEEAATWNTLEASDRAWLGAFKAMLLGRLGQNERAQLVLRKDTLRKLDTADLQLALVDGFHAWLAALFKAQRWTELCEVAAVMNAWQSPAVRRSELLACLVVSLFALGRTRELLGPASEMLDLARDGVDRAQAHFFLGFAYESAGDLPAAAASARVAYEALGQSADAQMARALHARASLSLGRVDDALLSAEGIDPNQLPTHAVWLAHSLHGAALLRVGSFEAASAMLERAAEKSPSDRERVVVLAQLALAHEALGQTKPARERAEQALTLLRDEAVSSDVQRARAVAHIVVARVAELENDARVALGALRQAECEWPGLGQERAFVELAALLLVRLGRHDETRVLLEHAQRDGELCDHPHAHFLNGVCAARRGEAGDAVASWLAATELPEHHAGSSAAQLASVAAHVALGDEAGARKALEELPPGGGERERAPRLRLWRALLAAREPGARVKRSRDLEGLTPRAGVELVLVELARSAAHAEAGHPREAKQAAELALGALRVLPTAPPSLAVFVQLTRAHAAFALFAAGETLEALEAALAVPAIDDRIVDALHDLTRISRAAMLSSWRRHEEALRDVHRARAGLRTKRAEYALDARWWALAEQRARCLEGHVLTALDRHEEAMAVLGPLLAEPNSVLRAAASALKAEALLGLEEWPRALDQAIAARGQLDELGHPEHAARIEVYARLREARARLRRREHAEVIGVLQAALENRPEAAGANPELWLLLGLAYYASERHEPACHALESAQRVTTRLDGGELRRAIALAHSAALIKRGLHARARALLQSPDAQDAALAFNRGVTELESYRESRRSAELAQAASAFRTAAGLGMRGAHGLVRELELRNGPVQAWLTRHPSSEDRLLVGGLSLGLFLLVPALAFVVGNALGSFVTLVWVLGACALLVGPRLRERLPGRRPLPRPEPLADLPELTDSTHTTLLPVLLEPSAGPLPAHADPLVLGELLRSPLALSFGALSQRPAEPVKRAERAAPAATR